jgi:hypothetical protein
MELHHVFKRSGMPVIVTPKEEFDVWLHAATDEATSFQRSLANTSGHVISLWENVARNRRTNDSCGHI